MIFLEKPEVFKYFSENWLISVLVFNNWKYAQDLFYYSKNKVQRNQSFLFIVINARFIYVWRLIYMFLKCLVLELPIAVLLQLMYFV